MKKYILLLFFPTPLFAFTLLNKPIQGTLILGYTEKGDNLLINNQKIPQDEKGYFAYGIPKEASFLTIQTNNKNIKKITVAPKKWKETFINGLENEKVFISPENQRRIEKENSLLAEKRTHFNAKSFPKCFIRPLKNARLSATFGDRRVLNGKAKSGHSGCDYATKSGTPIMAIAGGEVKVVHKDMFYTGKTILIDHGFGIFSSYSHLSSIDVKENQKIKRGDIIGKLGNTGRSTGPHLHLTISWHNVRVDPEQVFNDFPCK